MPPFVLTGKSDVIFRFFTGSAVNYGIDNVSVSRLGYYADGTLDEMPNETPNETVGFIENGDFSDSPAVAASTLAYAWIKAEDGKWAYSVNTGEHADAECTLRHGDINGEKCLKVDTNSNPSVSCALNGTVKPGSYL